MALERAQECEEAAEDGLTEVLRLTVRHREFHRRLELLLLAWRRLLEELLRHVWLLRAVSEFNFQLALRLTRHLVFTIALAILHCALRSWSRNIKLLGGCLGTGLLVVS